MRLDQFACVIIYFLPETHRGFIRVHVLEITRQPTQLSRHAEPVTRPAAGQPVPSAKFLFIVRSRTYGLVTSLVRVALVGNNLDGSLKHPAKILIC